MFHDNKRSFVVVWNTNFAEEAISRLADNLREVLISDAK